MRLPPTVALIHIFAYADTSDANLISVHPHTWILDLRMAKT